MSSNYYPLNPRSCGPNDSMTKTLAADSPQTRHEGESTPHISLKSGWSSQLVLLICNGIVSTCWGIALFVFALPGGILPAPDGWVGQHPAITNTIAAFVATLSTTHITFIMQRLVEEYSLYRMVKGFTTSQLHWMHGVQTRSLVTRFQAKHRRSGGLFAQCIAWITTRSQIIWLIVYAGFAIHTSAVVSIFQLVTVVKNYPNSENPVPCGIDASNLTLGMDPSLNETQQSTVDLFALKMGLQFEDYDVQLYWNISTSVLDQSYVKDSYAYGLFGYQGPSGGFQDVPGVLYNAQCSDAAENATAIWKNVFPDRSPPNITTSINGLWTFTDSDLPPQIESVVSDTEPFNITQGRGAMYALVESSGSGALFTITSSSESSSPPTTTTICSWKTFPKMIRAFLPPNSRTAGVFLATATTKYPAPVGRSTLITLQGMAQGYRLGASLRGISANLWQLAIPTTIPGFFFEPIPPSTILESVLADGGKASMTLYNAIGDRHSDVEMCSSYSVDGSAITKFVHTRGIGWIAVIWTTGAGILAIWGALWLKGKERVISWSILQVDDAFVLGRGGIAQEDAVFCVKGGVIAET